MKNYIIYDEDGNILRTGRCPANMLNLQVKLGEYIMEGVANDSTQIISGNQLQNKPIDVVSLKVDFQDNLRVARNGILSSTDWTQMPDAPLTIAEKAGWQTYRQSLRDLPSNYPNETDLNNVIFPTEPT
jgi:hypothetical protein